MVEENCPEFIVGVEGTVLTGIGLVEGVGKDGPTRFRAFPVNVYEDPPTKPLTCIFTVLEDKTCESDELIL